MVRDECVVGAIPKGYGAPLLIDRRFIPSSTQDVHERRQASTAAWSRASDPACFEANVRATFAGDVGDGRDRGRIPESIDALGKSSGCRLVPARRERDGDFAIRTSIELCRTTGAGTCPSAATSVLSLEQPTVDESLEVEGG
jgi:hypothetical protein